MDYNYIKYMTLNKDWYYDKVYACWLGKNIGGTIGAPYEGTKEMLDIKGFKTKPGEPLPNDDLDLQLLWLFIVEREGINKVNQNLLAEYWVDWIPPHWNEYGIARQNLKSGLLPPLSGEIENKRWQTSNGAWIRSEVWALLFPYCGDVAMKYASMDAMVDHGISEGTYAEIFTVAIQNAAIYNSDIMSIIENALTKIPKDCLISKAVRLVIEEYRKGTDYKAVRNMLVELTKELGYFQAPANIGYVIIGLLYGEGDFKKSVLYAVNCGDDTDCTAATVGATLGILGGTAIIPQDWRDYIGDRIVTISINGQEVYLLPKTCTELTEQLIRNIPAVMSNFDVSVSFTDGETKFDEKIIKQYNQKTADDIIKLTKYSYEILNFHPFSARLEYEKCPKIAPLETHKVRIHFLNNYQEPRRMNLRLIMPDGWTAGAYQKTICLEIKANQDNVDYTQFVDFEITAGESVDAINNVYLEVSSATFAQRVMIPIVFVS